jgi:putative membrane protein
VIAAALAGYAALVETSLYALIGDKITLRSNIHALLGLVLGMLLVFRTNTAYDRWWEGRKLWGQLVNESRNFAVKVLTCVRAPDAERMQAIQWYVSFSTALKDHLRGGARLDTLPGFKETRENPAHVPAAIVRHLYARIERWRQSQQLGEIELLFIDRHTSALLEICGACERILKTPISESYRGFIRQSVAIYLLSLPWGLAGEIGWLTVPASALIGYFMVGIELLAEDVEEPFGTGRDDLMLDDLCEVIKTSVSDLVEQHRTSPPAE